MATMEEHEQRRRAAKAQVTEFYKRKETFRIYHGSTNSTRIVEFDPDKMVDMSGFNHVLQVDTNRRVAVVEANVPMDKLVEETLKYGLVPPVVMEFPGITVGGGYMGVAGESSSWKYGFFDRTVNWVDCILLDGEARRASPTMNPDLFKGLPGTYGTVAVTVLFEIQLIPAKKYVELEYVKVNSMSKATHVINHYIQKADVEYIDGILFSAQEGVIVLGRLTNQTPTKKKPLQRFAGAFDPWFYVHAEKVCEASEVDGTEANHVERVPLVDYLFRYDRGAFWTGRYAFSRFHTPFNRVSRAILDPIMHTRPMYAALNASRYTTQYVIQDIALPFYAAEDFVNWNKETTKIWPLWLCPLRIEGENTVPLRARIGRKVELDKPAEFDEKREGWGGLTTTQNQKPDTAADGNNAEQQENAAATVASSSSSSYSNARPSETTMLLNVGIWGPGPRNHAKFVELNRQLEHTVAKLGGFKWLYANAYYTEEEFWRIYDRPWYEWLRGWYGGGEAWLREQGNDVWQRTRAKNAAVDGGGEQEKISGIRGVMVAVRMVARQKLGLGDRARARYLLARGPGGRQAQRLKKKL